ncbi:hypothetical protein F2Q70_00005379 [Brassica cretica]|uniref:Transmembrane protein n=1 Tax=Brassica cretica TaxID=69181 RepID=A0A8S9J3A4_BRACR|nr:hypothetical protein F2Q70_00005379 [Brassica cretica]
MGDTKRLVILSIISLLFLSQFLLLCSAHVNDEVGVPRKLGVFIRKRRGFRYRRPHSTTRSASATLLPGSFHVTACLASSFLLPLLL